MPDLSGPPGHRRNAARTAAIRKSREGGSGMKVKDVSIRLRARKIDELADRLYREPLLLELSEQDERNLFDIKKLSNEIVDLCEGNDVDEH